MSAPWAAALEISPELAQTLIAGQFPELVPVGIELLGSGWDSTAYLVNRQIVFRFPRRRLGAECLENEARVLSALDAPLPLPVPRPALIGRASDRFPWLFVGHRRLEGETACSRALDNSQRQACAEPL